MFCAISASVPQEPVVSTKSGHLFEKRLIEKHIKDTGKDPITGTDTSVEDLISVKNNTNVKPRPSPATSIPGILGLLHNEWDATMLEQHNLRQQLQSTRQELSHALYQGDGAIRVIARLKKERDEARHMLETVQRAPPAAAAAEPAEAAPELTNGKRAAEDGTEGGGKRAKAGITDDIIEVLTATSAELSKGRRKRPMPAGLATPESIGQYGLLSSHPLHKTAEGGITAIDLSPSSDDVIATAGRDHVVQIYDRAQQRKLSELTGHSKRVTDCKFMGHQDIVVTTSADKTARLWSTEAGNYKCKAVLSDHSAEVVGVALHPTNKYFITASADKSWAFYDLESCLCMAQITGGTDAGYSSVALHPDGQILGTGTEDATVHVWETKSQNNVAKFETRAGAPVTDISFSENGYYLATAAGDSVKLWDLRKLKNFRTITPYDNGGHVTSVKFDYSGQYLAVGGADARVYGVKADWALLSTLADAPQKGQQSVLSCTWNKPATKLYVGSIDHNLRIFGAPTA